MSNLPDIWRDFDRPFSSLGSSIGSWRPLLRQLDDVFNEATGSQQTGDTRTFAPACDVDETNDHYLLSFDMPGLDRDAIDVEVQGNTLMVSGERRFEKDTGEGRNRVVERRYGKFQRAITLPDHVQFDQVEADYRNGVLTVAVPKAPEAQAQKIKIGEGKGGLFSRLLGSGRKRDEKEREAIDGKSSEGSRTASH